MKTEITTDKPSGEHILRGIGVSSGIAIGPAYVIDQHGIAVPEYVIQSLQVDKELERLHVAIAKTQKQLGHVKRKADAMPEGAADEITLLLEAYRGMLSGSSLVRGVEGVIKNDRVNAEAAVQRQISAIAASFAAMDDQYLAARGGDVRDVGNRLIRNLMQQQYNPFADAPEYSILVAEDISTADTALMNPERIAGFAAVLGGAEGHTAIMARALGLPAVLGVTELARGVNTGDLLIVDGGEGIVITRPAPATLQRYKQEAVRLTRENRKLKAALRDVPAITTDGMPVTLHANLELAREIENAIDHGAEGIGLLRTEFMFMNRSDLPNEEEQYETLRGIVESLDGKPLTVRTLDVCGEKLATALGEIIGDSVNPALGLRAIRLCLREPKLFETQLAAILRAGAHGPVRILIPMVSSVSQVRKVREHLAQVEKRLHRRGVRIAATTPPLGAMIEIPAAALAADSLSRVCDFLSIGSNDLTQYTLAIDRGDDRVADLYDPFHPAVLRLIQFTIAAAWRANIPVCLCGEMAGDPRAVPLLLGLGLREFSMAPSRLPIVKQEIRTLAMPQAVDLAEAVMSKSDETDIRALLEDGLAGGGKKKR